LFVGLVVRWLGWFGVCGWFMVCSLGLRLTRSVYGLVCWFIALPPFYVCRIYGRLRIAFVPLLPFGLPLRIPIPFLPRLPDCHCGLRIFGRCGRFAVDGFYGLDTVWFLLGWLVLVYWFSWVGSSFGWFRFGLVSFGSLVGFPLVRWFLVLVGFPLDTIF